MLPLGNPTLTFYQDLSSLRNNCAAPKSFMDAALDPYAGAIQGAAWDEFTENVLACSSLPNPTACVTSALMNFAAEKQGPPLGSLARTYPPYGQTFVG